MPSLLRKTMVLAAATVAAMVLPGLAMARVGVTTATDGDPLGRPPTAAERVLRVGIDIEANERVTTNATDRAHVVFLDGTSITVGPNSALSIDKFVFDPNAAKGDMGLTLTKGVFRLVGGKISKSEEIVVTTPSATIGIRGGIVTVNVDNDGKTSANFVYGESMRVTSQGSTQTARRAGSHIEAAPGRAPTPPATVPFGALSAVTKVLEPPPAIVAAPVAVTLAATTAAAIDNSKTLLTSKAGRETDLDRRKHGHHPRGQADRKGETRGEVKKASVAVIATPIPKAISLAKPAQRAVVQQNVNNNGKSNKN